MIRLDPHSSRNLIWRRLGAAAIAAAGVLAACSDSNSPGGGNGISTTVTGTFVDTTGANTSGAVTLTIETGTPAPPAMVQAAMVTVNVTGTLTLAGGGTVSLTGSYDTDTKAITASGGGYSFTGIYAGGTINGSWTGPSNSGGAFTAAASTGAVTVYCGTYTSDTPGSGSGFFNLVDKNGTLSGLATGGPGEASTPLSGTLSGSTINLTFTVDNNGTPLQGTATGTKNGNDISGTYDLPGQDTGTWSGSVCQ